MTPLQRARRIRQLNDRINSLDRERITLSTELRSLENTESLSRGYRVPLRGQQLIDTMNREAARKVA